MCSSVRLVFFLILIGKISASFQPDIGLLKTLVGGDKVELLKFGLKLFLKSQSEVNKPEDKQLVSKDVSKVDDYDEMEMEPYLDVYDYMKAFMAERKIKLHRKLMIFLMDLPSGRNFHIHLARISVILETVGKINDLQRSTLEEKVFEIIKNGNSAEEIKNSLLKLYESAIKPAPELVNSEFPESTVYAASILQMIKSDPDKILNVAIPMISSYNLMSKETFQVFEMGLRMIPKTSYFPDIMDGVTSLTINIASTGIGQKLVGMIPILARAENASQIVRMVEMESGTSLRSALLQLNKPEIKEEVLLTSAHIMTRFVNFFQTVIGDNTKMTMINAVLMTQGFPSINPRKIIGSSLKFIEKIIRTFTAWKVDFRQLERNLKSHLAEFEKEGTSWEDFKTLDKKQKVEVMSSFVVKTLGEPVSMVWTANVYLSNRTDNFGCAGYFLCSVNSRMITTKATDFQVAVAKGLSYVSAWIWSLDGQLDQANLFDAIMSAENGSNCEDHFEIENGNCRIFEWQKSKSENYFDNQITHDEL